MAEPLDKATMLLIQQIAESLRKITAQQADIVACMRILAQYYEKESRKKAN